MRARSRLAGAIAAVFVAVPLLLATRPTVAVTAPWSAAAPSATCGVSGTAAAQPARQIDLVLDDSGSMFESPDASRWSDAKYSLEVFAALLEPNDTLNVFRMSDFRNGAVAPPQLRLKGSSPSQQNVQSIAAMTMQGGGTPYAPVTAAMNDLSGATADDKWLVVLTDGGFDDRTQPEVQGDLTGWVAGGANRRVAFMTIGDAAPTYPAQLGPAITTAHVSSSDVLGKLNGFANVVFGRSELTQTAAGRADTDGIGLDEAIVFVQGAGATIGSANAGGKSHKPSSRTNVSWVPNPPVDGATPVPNKALIGQLATLGKLPGGAIDFTVSGATTDNVAIFYKPTARFEVELTDSAGRKVDKDKALAGTYVVDYGFVDDKCRIVDSPLFGTVAYDATIVEDGKPVVEHFKPGGKVTLGRGKVVVQASAQYLSTATAHQDVPLTIQEPARAASVTSTAPKYDASKLGDYRAPRDAVVLHYQALSGGKAVPFTADEWKTITPGSFTVKSSKNIHFTVSVGSTPGEVFLVPHAPAGGVYRADTGRIPLTVTGSHVYDDQLNRMSYSTAIQVADDIPWWERAWNWFTTEGWKFAIGLLLLILLCGYLFKRRFSKKIKRSPRIVGTSNTIGRANEEARGKFIVSPGRRLLPFVADTATLRFTPPGVVGFKTMKLKAGPGKTMLLENWRQLAEKSNVEVNGMELNEETRRPPRLSASTPITARTPVMTYDMTPME